MKLTPEQEYAKREETGGAPHFDKFGFVINNNVDATEEGTTNDRPRKL